MEPNKIFLPLSAYGAARSQSDAFFNVSVFPGVILSHTHALGSRATLSSDAQLSALKFSVDGSSFAPKFDLIRSFVPSLSFRPLPQVQGKAILCDGAVMCAVAGMVSPFLIVNARVVGDGSECAGATEVNFQQKNSNIGIALKHEKGCLRNLKKSITRVTAVFGSRSYNIGVCLKPTDIDRLAFNWECLASFRIGAKTKGSVLVSVGEGGDDVVGNLRVMKKADRAIKYGLDASVNRKREFAINFGYCVKLKDTVVRGLVSSKKEVASTFTKRFSDSFSFEVGSILNYPRNDFNMGFSFYFDSSNIFK